MSDELRAAIGGLIESVKSDPQNAAAVFRATSTSETPGFSVGSAVRDFSVVHDEPRQLGGEDTGPNPVEAVLAALGSCQAIVYRAYAAALGLRIDRVQVQTTGHLDLRGFLNLGPVPAGFGRVSYDVRIESPETPEKIRELARLVDEHCPVLDTLRRPVEVSSALEIVSTPEAATYAA
jgi:uncharacterized OsmC-like protein